MQTRLLLTDNWSLWFLIYKQWDIEWLWGSLTLSTNGFSSGNVGRVCVCHRPNVVAQYWCVRVATEVKYFYSFDNNIYIWLTWICLTLWDCRFKINNKHFTCWFLCAALPYPILVLQSNSLTKACLTWFKLFIEVLLKWVFSYKWIIVFVKITQEVENITKFLGNIFWT